MRIHQLSLQAVGPFADKEEIDFTRIDQAGLFLLDGPTGAGKSTILNAITYALYGTITGGRRLGSLHSTRAAVGVRPEIELDVSIGQRRFHITRWPSFERPAKRQRAGQTRMTTEQAGIVLKEFKDGQWVALTTRNDEAGQLLGEVLGLKAEEFMRVVLLPQGEFAQFLRASSKEREELLRKLFGTQRFEKVPEHLKTTRDNLWNQVKEDQSDMARLRDEVETTLTKLAEAEWLDEDPKSFPPLQDEQFFEKAVELTGQTVTTAETRLEEVRKNEKERRKQLEQLQKDRDSIHRARTFLQRRQQHQDQAEQIETLRTSLKRHKASENILRWHSKWESAAAKAAETKKRADQALEALHAAPLFDSWAPDHGPSDAHSHRAEEWEALFEHGRAQIHEINARIVEQNQLAELKKNIETWNGQIKEADTSIASAEELQDTQQQDQEQLEEELSTLGDTSVEVERLGHEEQQLKSLLESARNLVDAQQKHQELTASKTEATDAAQAARDEHQALVQRRIDAAALFLSAQLEPGEPCSVCGSTEHPHPAAGEGTEADLEEVSAERIEASQEHLDELEAARSTAQSVVERHQQLITGLEEETGGQSVEVAEKTLEEHQEELTKVKKRDARRKEIEKNLQELRKRLEDGTKQLSSLKTGRETLKTEVKTAEDRIEELQFAIERALADFPDLQSVKTAIEQTVEASDRVVRSLRQETADTQTVASEKNNLDEAFAEANAELDDPFQDVSEARQAQLPATEATNGEEQVSTWDKAKIALKAQSQDERVIAGLSLLDQGRSEPDEEAIAEAQQGLQAAEDQVQQASTQLGRLQTNDEATKTRRSRADKILARSQDLLEEYSTVDELYKVVLGDTSENSLKMSLQSYVLTGRLEKVAAAASERLSAMTQGRYSLEHDDSRTGRGRSGLDLRVRDHVNDTERGPETLSGGESFMASLALALGLADTVQAEAGGIKMDTLFIDEGFGSLDQDTLEQVMEVLDGLQDSGRVVGVVSHVEAMKSQIPYQIQVRKQAAGSTIHLSTPEEG